MIRVAVVLGAAALLAACSGGSTHPATSGRSTSTSTTVPTSVSAPPSSTTSSTAAPAHTPTSQARSVTTVPAQPTTVTVGASDNGGTVNLHVGDTLVIQLSGCGGCGYTWRMTGQPNAVVFTYEGAQTSTATTSTTAGQPPVVGAPVTYTWTFKAVSAHTTGFTAAYYPPSGSAPSQSFAVTLHVS